MKWIKATDKYPQLGWYLAKVLGTGKSFPAHFATNVISSVSGNTYSKETIEYIDESSEEVVFTIEDMKKCWRESRFIDIQGNFVYDFNTFMKQQHKIDL